MNAVLDTIASLQSNGVIPEKIIENVAESGCPLEMIFCMENTQLNRALFEGRKWKQMSFEQRSYFVAFAMSRDYLLHNKKTVEHHLYNGRHPSKKKMTFLKALENMLEDPNSDLEMIKWLIRQLTIQNLIDKNVLALLQRTFNSGTEKAVQILLDCGIDMHVKDKFGCDLKTHLFGNRNINVSNFLRRGFDLNSKGKADFRALHFAAKKDIIENVKQLLKAGADPNSTDEDGASPLFVAQSEKCIALLLQHGTDIASVCNYGYTVFDVFFGNQKNILIAHLTLLKARGTPIKQEIHDQVLLDTELKAFYEEYNRQLEWMKRQYIKKSFTLFAALVEKVEILVHYMRDESILKFINVCQKQKLCWYYTHTLEKNFKKALMMHSLQRTAALIIAENIIVFDCNHLVTTKIVDMLSFKDLQMFVR